MLWWLCDCKHFEDAGLAINVNCCWNIDVQFSCYNSCVNDLKKLIQPSVLIVGEVLVSQDQCYDGCVSARGLQRSSHQYNWQAAIDPSPTLTSDTQKSGGWHTSRDISCLSTHHVGLTILTPIPCAMIASALDCWQWMDGCWERWEPVPIGGSYLFSMGHHPSTSIPFWNQCPLKLKAASSAESITFSELNHLHRFDPTYPS